MSIHIESVGSGPPLVALHGWAMHSGLWLPVLPQLAQHFRLHCVDLPGHGYSDTTNPYTLASITDVVAAACDDAVGGDERPLTLMGWSMGGAVAMQWANSRPERVGALILTCTTPCFTTRPDWRHAMSEQVLRQFGDELSASYKLTLQRFVSLQVQGSEHARDILAQMRTQLFARGEPSPDALRAALEVLIATDLRRDVPGIRHPALVIGGNHDTLAPIAASRWLEDALPNATLVEITGAAHAPFLSHTDAFLKALFAFTLKRSHACKAATVAQADIE